MEAEAREKQGAGRDAKPESAGALELEELSKRTLSSCLQEELTLTLSPGAGFRSSDPSNL